MYMERLRDLNVPKVCDVGCTLNGFPYYSQQWIDGYRLRDFIIYHYLDNNILNRAALYVLSVFAHTLDQIHHRGLVHRDLKPEHVLRCERGEVWLLDWGIAAPEGWTERTARVVGTPSYMAPEQALGRPASTAMDIYAMGAMLFEILTGEPPVPDDEPPLALERLVYGALPRVSARAPMIAACWPELSRTCEAALSPCPSDRPHQAAEIATQIMAASRGL